MTKKCVIFAGGDIVSKGKIYEKLKDDQYIICADSGYRMAKMYDIKVDLVIGDFDSMPEPENEKIVIYPKEKDDTDLMLAAKCGLEHGCEYFYIYGATGGRLDHTFAAIQSLAYIKNNNADGEIIADNQWIKIYTPGEYIIKEKEGFSLSLFSYSEYVSGLYLSGTKYECKNAELKNDFPLGVSNEIINEKAQISFKSGLLLIICSEL